MEEAIDHFIRHQATERGLSDNYQLLTRRNLETTAEWLRKEHGIGHPREVTADHLTAYLAWRKSAMNPVEGGPSRKGPHALRASSLRLVLASWRGFYRFLLARGLVTHDPTSQLLAPRVQKPLPKPVPEGALSGMLTAIDVTRPLGPRDLALLELIYASGLRVSEAARARLDEINLDEGFIRVTGKGRKTRLVPVGSRAREALTAYLNVERPRLVGRRTGGELFLNEHGRPLTRQRIWQIIQQRAQAAGIEESVGPHRLRHSFATHMLSRGADLRVIQELLGHADISTTQVYTKVDNVALQRVHQLCHPRAKLPSKK